MVDVNYENWETIIGLEIHVQLNTKSKMFGGEPYRFGSEPNTDIGVVCTGQPGALPTVNKEAVHKAIQFGCAVHGSVSLVSRFDRKSYFYPDTPKNYQITQFEHPIVRGGSIAADVSGETKHFKINRAHLEEDAGMLKHFTNFSGVDYNRSGVPLLEIVSEPCMHSPKEASAYAMAIKAIMEYLDVSDCNMEAGSLRIDANISVRPKGEQGFRNKIEIKNMNSFSHMEIALESEIRRQIQFYLKHPHEKIEHGTYRFDTETGQVIRMRVKEQADDYRYFPEPDLPPIALTETYIEQVRKALPELPRERYKRYISELELPEQPATLLINDKKLSDYFEAALKKCSNGKSLAVWLTVEFPGRLKELSKTLWDIPSDHIAELVNLIDNSTINGKIAKSVADEMVQKPGTSPSSIVKANPDFQPLSDTGAIEAIVDQVLSENPQVVADYRAGTKKAFAFLVGQIMKASRGKASPTIVNELLLKKL
ncbi:MAG TPA: Asp-tRNA(Asn)/Glu-tRNA(Gln) amidotransferase subunit GatB [Rhabdochlamydiaceae bacterium]|jgi:aspartyl-tRNA(Asn)/glutamyl-tRNA(Gln) amidotransferase subunit B|nr:Asp-tRNA(Asn)/Glu-tRNA(Gln) amidotransferase subunit GatB [Rhabdochlamydiaceae bacterium]